MKLCVKCGKECEGEGLLCMECMLWDSGHDASAAPEETAEVTGEVPLVLGDDRVDVEHTLLIPLQSGQRVAEELGTSIPDLDEQLNYAGDLFAEDRVQEAANTCRYALEFHPHSVQAYALLGMAEEEMGNWNLAVEAYERTLELDPDRIIERDRLVRLQARMASHVGPQDTHEEQVRQADALRRVAPMALAVGAGILVILVSLLLMVHARNARIAKELNDTYQLQLAQGQVAVRQGDYTSAATWFQQALTSRPSDQTAGQWLAWVQQQSQTQAQYDQWRYSTLDGKWMGGQGVLPPTPVAGQPATADTNGTGLVNMPPSTVNAYPGVTNWPQPANTGDTRTVGAHERDAYPAPDASVTPNPPSSQVPSTGSVTSPAAPVPVHAVAPPAPAVPERTGEIRIERSESRPTLASGQDGLSLRNLGDKQRLSGAGSAAISTYERAISALQLEIERNPASAGIRRTAIESCRNAINQIRSN